MLAVGGGARREKKEGFRQDTKVLRPALLLFTLESFQNPHRIYWGHLAFPHWNLELLSPRPHQLSALSWTYCHS